MLNDRQRIFCREYIKDFDLAAASKRAGYKQPVFLYDKQEIIDKLSKDCKEISEKKLFESIKAIVRIYEKIKKNKNPNKAIKQAKNITKLLEYICDFDKKML